MQNQNTLSTNVNIQIPEFITDWAAAKPYLNNIKASPNSFSMDIEYWQKNARTNLGELVRQFLNGEAVNVNTNRLTITISKKIVKNVDDVIKMVDDIFNRNCISFKARINDRFKIDAKIVPNSHKIISQIYEEHFFEFKDPIRIRVNFATTLQLKHHIAELPDYKLKKGITVCSDEQFFTILKKMMNDPDALYISKESGDYDSLSQQIYASYFPLAEKPTIFSAPKTIEDIERIFFCEYFYKQPISLDALCSLAKDFGIHRETLGIEKIGESYARSNMVFGLYHEPGYSSLNISFPTSFSDLDEFYEKLETLIKRLEVTDDELKKIQDAARNKCITVGSDDIKITAIINNGDISRHRYTKFRFPYLQTQAPKYSTNDPERNFQDLKDGVRKLLANCKKLESFFRHELFAFYANENISIKRPELSKFIFSRIMVDPISYVDCGNKFYEKFSRMITNL